MNGRKQMSKGVERKWGVRSKSEGGKQISEKGEQMSKWGETE